MAIRYVKSDHDESTIKNWGDPEYRNSYLKTHREMRKEYGPDPRTEAFIRKLDEQHGYTENPKSKTEQMQNRMPDAAAA